MSFETLKFDLVEGTQVGVLTLSRPKALNALNSQVMAELGIFLSEVVEKDLRALIVTGEGEKSFVAGADIKEMADYSEKEAREMAERGHKVFKGFEALDFPVIAAVNGFALGGGLELALSCDFIIASESAKFGLPEVSLGLIPGYGGTQRLSRVIGLNNTRRLVFTGDMIKADEAQKIGLVSLCVAQDELMPMALKTAKTIASRGPKAVAYAKEVINMASHLHISEALDVETGYFAKTFETKDHSEGISAFIEKRAPQFKNQ